MALTVAANATPLDIQVHTVPLKVFGRQKNKVVFVEAGKYLWPFY